MLHEGRRASAAGVALGLLLFVILASSHLARIPAAERGGAVTPAPDAIQRAPGTTPVGGEGALHIRLLASVRGGKRGLDPPAELLLTDPLGKKLGRDSRLNREYQEIPRSYYEGEAVNEPGATDRAPASLELVIANPANGTYHLKVIATATGRYDLHVIGFDRGGGGSPMDLFDVNIQTGALHVYVIRYSDTVGAEIQVIRQR